MVTSDADVRIEVGALPTPAEGGEQPCTLSLEHASYRALEVDGLVHINVLRSGSDANACSVRVRTRDGSARGGVHYVKMDETVTFEPGEKSKSVTAYIFDSPDQSSYVFSVVLSEARALAGKRQRRSSARTFEVAIGATSEATVVIVDTDQKTLPKTLLNSGAFQVIVFLSTAFALFGNDISAVYGGPKTDPIIDAITALNIAVFSLELVLMAIVKGKAYVPSIQLGMDLLAIFGLVALLPSFARALGSGAGIGVLARAGRAARVAAKAGRTIKVPQLLGKIIHFAAVAAAWVQSKKKKRKAEDDEFGDGEDAGDKGAGKIGAGDGNGADDGYDGSEGHAEEGATDPRAPTLLESMSARSLGRVQEEVKEATAETADGAMVDNASRAGKIGATVLDLLTSKVILMMLMLLVCAEFITVIEVPAQKELGLDVLEALGPSAADVAVPTAAFEDVLAIFKASAASLHEDGKGDEAPATAYNVREPLLYLRINGIEYNDDLNAQRVTSLRSMEMRAVSSEGCSFDPFDVYSDLVEPVGASGPGASQCPSAAVFDNSSFSRADAAASMGLTCAIVVILSIGMGLMAVDFRERMGEPLAHMMDTMGAVKALVSGTPFGAGGAIEEEDDEEDDDDDSDPSDSGGDDPSESGDAAEVAQGRSKRARATLRRLRNIVGTPKSFSAGVVNVHKTYERIYSSMLGLTKDVENAFGVRMTAVRNRLIMRNQELGNVFTSLEDAARQVASGEIRLVDMSEFAVMTSRAGQGVVEDAMLAVNKDEPKPDSEADASAVSAGASSMSESARPSALRRVESVTRVLEAHSEAYLSKLEDAMAERGVAVPPSGVTLGAALGFAESAAVDAAASTIRSVAARLSESGVVGDAFKRAAQKHASASGDGTGPRAPSAAEATSLSSDSIDTLDSRVASLVAVLASEKIESLGFSVPDDMPLLESADQQQDVLGARLRGTLLRLENAFVHNSLIALEEKGVCLPREDVLREDPSAAPCMSMRGLKAATEQSLVALAKQALEASGPAEGARSLQGMSQNDLLRAAADALVQAALDGGDAFASLPPVVKHAAKAGGEALLRAAASPEGVETFLATVGPSDLSSLLEMAVQKSKAADGEEDDDAQAHATELALDHMSFIAEAAKALAGAEGGGRVAAAISLVLSAAERGLVPEGALGTIDLRLLRLVRGAAGTGPTERSGSS